MMLNMLRLIDRNGECNLEMLVRTYVEFYRQRLELGVAADREQCPYGRMEYLDDFNQLQRSLLANPFEKFERKRFLYHCKDLGNVAFSSSLWSRINSGGDLNRIRQKFFDDLLAYYEPLGGIPNESELRDLWNVPVSGQDDEQSAPELSLVVHDEVDASEQYSSCVPFFSLQAAAGAFSDGQEVEPEGWVEVGSRHRLEEGMFVAQVVGHSMEPRIPDGAYCLFKFYEGGSRSGRIVLVQHHEIADPDHGGRYTVKQYESTKRIPSDESQEAWGHEHIVFKPLNKDYADIPFEGDPEELRVIAEFLDVLDG